MRGSDPARVLRLAAARSLAMDGVAAEVVTALRRAGVRSILLRGPAISGLLYPLEPREYGDVDLLVPPAGHADADAVLERLGFERQAIRIEPELGLPHAQPWGRADGAQVDLHRTLAGVGVSPAELWHALSSRTEESRIAGASVELLEPEARLLVVALHAFQHGAETERPQEDLRRAVELLPAESWERARELAGLVDALIGFSAGLRLVPEGERLAERLRLPSADLVQAARRARSPTRLVLGFELLATTEGTGAKLRLVLRELAPTPEHMRWWSPLARRGRLGLAAAYVQRVLQFVRHTPPSLLAWWRLSRRPN